jgi:hypothetical protein
MVKQERFYDVPTSEPPPRNRRIYAMAKAPFRYIWEFLAMVSSPFLKALPFAMVAAFVVGYMAHGHDQTFKALAWDAFTVGLIWTAVLGAVFAVFKLILGLLGR